VRSLLSPDGGDSATLGTVFGAAFPVLEFKEEGLALRERGDIGCVLLTAAVDAASVLNAPSAAVGVELPASHGRVSDGDGRRALWLSPRSWLVHCAVAEEIELVRRVNASFPDKLLHAALFTDALCWLELSGVRSLERLTEGGFLSLEPTGLPIGYAKRTLTAQIAAIVVREGEGVWLVAVERSRARYFVDWLRAGGEGAA
jgi:heterotetrameric sarcosine oxidase gamma subunit